MRAHLANTHSQGFFKVFLWVFVNMSLPGVELVLPSWKVGVVTASPPSKTFINDKYCVLALFVLSVF